MGMNIDLVIWSSPKTSRTIQAHGREEKGKLGRSEYVVDSR